MARAATTAPLTLGGGRGFEEKRTGVQGTYLKVFGCCGIGGGTGAALTETGRKIREAAAFKGAPLSTLLCGSGEPLAVTFIALGAAPPIALGDF